MKHPFLLAAMAAIFPSQGLLSAGPLTPSPQNSEQTAAHMAEGLAPEAIKALGSTLLLDEPGDGRTWARGSQWKASFGPAGMTYIPFFGSDAPKNYPVGFDLVAVTSGAEMIALQDRKRSRDGQQVILDRGPVDEVYNLTKDTVEQTFVFDFLPSRQDLVLDIQVTTELTPSQSAVGGFEFSNELGMVHYGRAYAFDAAGKSIELQQRFTDDGIRITVPSGFIEQAQLPLVVDPVITTFPITHNTRQQVDIDSAYDWSNTLTQVVYSERHSALDMDVLSVHYNASIGLVVNSSSIDITSASWGMPRNASNVAEQQFLCVALVGNSIGSKRVWGRTRRADDGTLGPQFSISGVGAESVDVGGKGNDVASIYDYMVVWQEVDNINQDMDIVAQSVEADSTLTGGRIIIDGDPGDLDRAPAISKTSGDHNSGNADNKYMIVWEREVGPSNRNIRAQVIEYYGSMIGHNQFNAYTFSDSIRPDVSSISYFNTYGLAPYWILAFERRVGSLYKIFTVVARDGFADNARNLHTMRDMDQDLDHRTPKIAGGNDDFLVVFQTEATNGDWHVNATELNVVREDGELRTGLNYRHYSLAVSHQAWASFAVASDWDGGAWNPIRDTFFPVWVVRDAASGDTHADGADIYSDTREVAGSQYCDAEPNSSGSSGWARAFALFGGSTFRLDLAGSDLPQNVFGFFLVSNQSGFIANPGGSQGHLCLQGALGRFNRAGEILFSGSEGYYELRIDPAAMPSPNGLFSAQPGETWYFQSWFRDNGSNSNFTNGVEVTFD